MRPTPSSVNSHSSPSLLVAANNPNCIGMVSDLGYNLNSDTSGNFTNATSHNGVDPKRAPLADYGGPTLTLALLLNSPAIDSCEDIAAPPLDQWRFPRPIGPATDIGAFESGSPAMLAIDLNASGFDLVAGGKHGWTFQQLGGSSLQIRGLISTNQFGQSGMLRFPLQATNALQFFRGLVSGAD